jgi:MoaA/NifB/PqqE/SkfB family radical SAM enzyme
MSNKLPENACAYPFKAVMLMHGEPATPCCRFHPRFLNNDTRQAAQDLNPDDFRQIMRSEFKNNLLDFNAGTFQEVRDTMMRNEWHPGCYKCRADEQSKGSSMRTEANEFFDDFTDTVSIQYMEITVGRHCNLACISCGPEYSDKWDKDAIKFGQNTAYDVEQLKKIEELDLDLLREQNLVLLKDLKYIKVTGGEPFLHRQFLDFVVRLAAEGIAPQVELEIFTNCTWWPKKADYDALVQFRKIKINASIDGHGVVNDLLRWPSDWKRVEDTLDKWIKTRAEFGHDKIQIATATTVNVINAPYLYEFMYWAKVVKDIDVVLQTVYEPNYLSIYHWPNWYKDKLKYTIESQWNEHIKPGKIRPARDLLLKLCGVRVEQDHSLEYTNQLKRILRHRDQLEQLRACKKFTQLVDLEAQAIPEWGPGDRDEWTGRHGSAYGQK